MTNQKLFPNVIAVDVWMHLSSSSPPHSLLPYFYWLWLPFSMEIWLTSARTPVPGPHFTSLCLCLPPGPCVHLCVLFLLLGFKPGHTAVTISDNWAVFTNPRIFSMCEFDYFPKTLKCGEEDSHWPCSTQLLWSCWSHLHASVLLSKVSTSTLTCDLPQLKNSLSHSHPWILRNGIFSPLLIFAF